MNIETNLSLKKLNTFGIECFVEKYLTIESHGEIIEALKKGFFDNSPWLALGGGSNILFTKNFTGNIIKIENKGIQIISENDEKVLIKVEAGEDWNSFVLYCVNKNYYGVENLAMIPGKVGSCPIQNIGAYGSEVKTVIKSVEFFDVASGEIIYFTSEECQFAYRDSLFKRELKNKGIIISIIFELNKRKVFNINYADLQKELLYKPVAELMLKNIYEAICAIRKRKLPDPTEFGNAGSFFKNPTIHNSLFNKIKLNYPDISGFPTNPDETKISAAWLIDKSGWKGKRIGDVGVHNNQPLVLINYGNATGNEILFLANQIIKTVQENFDLILEKEVNIY